MTLRINDNGIDRDMTAEEQAAYETWQTVALQDNASAQQTASNKAAARVSALAKLAGLGLTDDEISALVG